MAKKIVETPLMKQYAEMKQKHPDAILLFRVGDFYETFSDDAIVASEILGITLTLNLQASPTMPLTAICRSWCEPARGWPSASSSRIPS